MVRRRQHLGKLRASPGQSQHPFLRTREKDFKIHLGSQGTLNSQKNPEEEEPWRAHTSQLQLITRFPWPWQCGADVRTDTQTMGRMGGSELQPHTTATASNRVDGAFPRSNQFGSHIQNQLSKWSQPLNVRPDRVALSGENTTVNLHDLGSDSGFVKGKKK